ncbi:MAG: hypothetical protein HZB76_02320 [Chlamydiae bacterium]|nr:hypothetical protein [Chlamydiota bacterium]
MAAIPGYMVTPSGTISHAVFSRCKERERNVGYINYSPKAAARQYYADRLSRISITPPKIINSEEAENRLRALAKTAPPFSTLPPELATRILAMAENPHVREVCKQFRDYYDDTPGVLEDILLEIAKIEIPDQLQELNNLAKLTYEKKPEKFFGLPEKVVVKRIYIMLIYEQLLKKIEKFDLLREGIVQKIDNQPPSYSPGEDLLKCLQLTRPMVQSLFNDLIKRKERSLDSFLHGRGIVIALKRNYPNKFVFLREFAKITPNELGENLETAFDEISESLTPVIIIALARGVLTRQVFNSLKKYGLIGVAATHLLDSILSVALLYQREAPLEADLNLFKDVLFAHCLGSVTNTCFKVYSLILDLLFLKLQEHNLATPMLPLINRLNMFLKNFLINASLHTAFISTCIGLAIGGLSLVNGRPDLQNYFHRNISRIIAPQRTIAPKIFRMVRAYRKLTTP